MKIATKLKIALRALLLKAGEVETDNGKLIWEGEGELTVGTEVFIETADGENVEVVPAPDGEYKADGKTYVVKDGKVDEIRDENVAEEPAEEPAEEEPVEAEETEAEPADENDETPEEEPLEDRVARLEARIAEITEGIEQLMNAIVGVAERMDAVEEKIAGLEKPATDPADDKDEQDFSEQKPSRLSYLKRK